MPEGITYWDIKRMPIAQISSGPHRIESHEKYHRKNQFPKSEPTLLKQYYHKEFFFNPFKIETCGKAIAFSLPSKYPKLSGTLSSRYCT